MKKILVIIDEQNDFTTGVLGNAECAATIPEVVKIVNSKEYDRVILTKDTHREDYMDTQEGKRLPVPHCIEGSHGWEIAKEIEDSCRYTFSQDQIDILCKPTFGSLELGELLSKYCKEYEEKEKDDHVEIHFAGVCTGICVISNVMIAKAAVPQARVCVIERACACVTPQSHNTAIEAMKTCQVDVME